MKRESLILAVLILLTVFFTSIILVCLSKVSELPLWVASIKSFLISGLVVYGLRTWFQYRNVLDSIKNDAQEVEKIHNRLTDYNESLHSVHSLTGDLSRICCLDDLHKLPEKLRNVFRFDFCQVWITDIDTDQVTCIGDNAENFSLVKIPSLVETGQNGNHTVMLQKTDNSEIEAFLSSMNLSSLVICPLVKEENELGMLLVGNVCESISDEQICFLESITGVLVGVIGKTELEEIERKDKSLLESLSAYTSDTVARIKMFQSTQRELEKKTLELRRVLNNLARARIKVTENVRLSVFSLSSVHIIKEINTLLLSLSSEVNELTELYHTLFMLDKNRMKRRMFGEKTEYHEMIEELEFLFERTVIELQRSIRLTSRIGNISSVVQKDVIQEENLIEIAQDVIGMIPKEKRESIVINIQSDHKSVWSVDRGHMEKVFYNLFANSLEAMNGKGELIVSSFKTGDDLCIRVKDTGPGVPQSYRNKIFLPFFSTKIADSVNGMGLALSSDIVRLYGGRLELTGDQNKGAEFSIYFSKKFSSK